MSIGDVKSMVLPVPPIEDQKAINEWCETRSKKFDAAITKANQEITLIKEYREALIAEAVTGKIDVRGWQKQREKAA